MRAATAENASQRPAYATSSRVLAVVFGRLVAETERRTNGAGSGAQPQGAQASADFAANAATSAAAACSLLRGNGKKKEKL